MFFFIVRLFIVSIIQPYIPFCSALLQCRGDAGEQFAIRMPVVVLAEPFLSAWGKSEGKILVAFLCGQANRHTVYSHFIFHCRNLLGVKTLLSLVCTRNTLSGRWPYVDAPTDDALRNRTRNSRRAALGFSVSRCLCAGCSRRRRKESCSPDVNKSLLLRRNKDKKSFNRYFHTTM